MHIYAFGSVCRGEVDKGSDVDLLAITNDPNHCYDPNIYSIYSYDRIKQLWEQGNPFAWHLSCESQLLFSSNKQDFIQDLGSPSPYVDGLSDCNKFYELFHEAKLSLSNENSCSVFDLSSVFLGIRNLAACFSLYVLKKADFSRNAAKNLSEYKIPITDAAYKVFEQSRILCTRGYGANLSATEISLAKSQLQLIDEWMLNLLKKAGEITYERI